MAGPVLEMVDGEEKIIYTLDTIDYDVVDMLSIVIVGNSSSYI